MLIFERLKQFMAPGESRSSFARKIKIAPQSLLDLELGRLYGGKRPRGLRESLG